MKCQQQQMFAAAIMLIDLSKHVYKIVIFTHEKTSQKMEFDGLYSRVGEDSLEVNSQEFPQRWFSDHTRITRVSIIEHIEVILPKRSVNLHEKLQTTLTDKYRYR